MWGIIATWRMAVEGISEASHILQEKGDAGDAIETAIKAVEDFPYYKSVGYGGLPNEEMEVELVLEQLRLLKILQIRYQLLDAYLKKK